MRRLLVHRPRLILTCTPCSGFPLDAPHDRLACSDCHAEFGQQKLELGSFNRSYPGRHPDDCRACHADPHQGQFEVGAYRGTNCLTCHHRHTFVPSAFTHVDHHRTRFPLVGAHSQVACNQCHKDDMEKTSTGGRQRSSLIHAEAGQDAGATPIV